MFYFSLKKHYLKVSCYVFVIALLAGLLSLDSAALSQEVQAAAPGPTTSPKASGTPTPKQTVTQKPGSATPAPAKTPLPGAGSAPVPAGNRIGGAKTPVLSAGDGNWFWQNPLPQGFSINSISCPQPANCLAVTNEGTVLLTTDGGATWIRQFFLGSFYLKDISCPALNNCFVVGFSGGYAGIYSSSIFHFDGVSWQVQYTDADTYFPLTSIACWARDGCIAVGNSMIVAYDGVNWNIEVSLIPYSSSAPVDIICPATRLCLITASAKIWRYSNGNWSSLDITTIDDHLTQLGNLACFSASHCLTTATYLVFLPPPDFISKPVFLETFDGGNSWTERAQPPFLAFDYHTRYSCPNVNTCYAITTFYTGNYNVSQVFITTNAGSSWTLIHDTIQPSLQALWCWNPTTCLLGGDNGLTLTYDNGNWNQLSSGNSVDYMTGISCPALNRCFAGGNLSLLSYDGRNWASNALTGFFEAVNCPAINVCYALLFGIKTTYVMFTTDSGQTWQTQMNISSSEFHSLSCPAVDTCFAVGDGGVISLKNGVWSAETSNTTAYLFSISCPATNLCFAVGKESNSTNSIILSYNGTSWNSQLSGISSMSSYLSGISCPSTTRCFAVAGTTLLSYDGTTWTVQPSVIPADVYNLDCPAVDTCFMIGSGRVVIYQNGVWTTQAIGTVYSDAISCPTVTTCFATANGGVIVKGYPVTSLSDDGSGTQPGTLSFGLKNTALNQPIIFNLKSGNTILVSGQLPPVPAGKPILGNCSTNGPTVTLEGGGTTTGGLVLSGDNFVAGLNVTGFNGRQLVLHGHGNRLQCMAANR